MLLTAVVVLLAGVDGGEDFTQAPDDEGLDSLLSESVVSAASRTAESASEAPATTWSISGTDLKRYGIQSVEEAIRFLGHGMTSYEFDSRQNAAFGARGYMSDNLGLHLAVLIDGNQAGGSAKTARGTQTWMLPIELVDHIDVVLGPGSVLYGNSAMLGIINIVTRSAASVGSGGVVAQGSLGTPSDRWAKDLSWGEAWGRGATWGSYRTTLGGDPFELAWHFALRWDRHEGRAMWRRTDDPLTVDPYTDPAKSFAREDVFNRDLRARLFGRATWGNFAFMGWVALAGGTGTGPIASSNADSSYFEPEYGLDITWSKHIGDRGDFSLRGYAVVFDSHATLGRFAEDRASCVTKVGTANCYDTLDYLNWRPFIEPTFSWDWARDGSHVTTLGAQAFVDGSYIKQGVKADDGSRSVSDPPIIAPLPTGAAYAQHIWRGRFGTVNLGVRGDIGVFGGAFSPRVAYSTSPWKNGLVKLIVATGFRNPTITERYLEIENFVTPNPNIRPERVYSAEVVLGHKQGAQSLMLSLYAAYWDGIITTRTVPINGFSVSQFTNLRYVWSAGANLGWQGHAGPFEYALSMSYAPGRLKLPPGVAQYTDQQLLDDLRVRRAALDKYGQNLGGSFFLPADGMPDFYATGHLSYSMGEGLPRISLAANLNSERMRAYYAPDPVVLDERHADGPVLPWSIDVRTAVSMPISERTTFSLVGTFKSLATVADGARVGVSDGPLPQGGIGTAYNVQAPVTIMAEVSLKL